MVTPLPSNAFTSIVALTDEQREQIEQRTQFLVAKVTREMHEWLLTHLLWVHQVDEIDRPLREIPHRALADYRDCWTVIIGARLEEEHDESHPANYTLAHMARALAANYLKTKAYVVYSNTLHAVLAHKLMWSIHLKRYVSRDEHERLVAAGEEHYGD